ncbi:MAG: ABC transporter transmembrane domain-containing protein, partial [Chloroflexota bacterium]
MRNECEQRVPSGQRELAPTIAFGTLGTFATIVQMTMLSTVAGSVLVDHQHLPAVLPLLLLLLGAIMVRAVLAWREEVSAQTAALRLTSTLRERLIVHLIQLGPAFVQYERSGELSTTAMEGVDRLTSYYQRYLPLGSLSLVTPALIICFLLKINLLGALVLLGTAPVIPLLMVLIGSYSHTHVQRHWLALTRLGAQFLDTLQGLPTLLLFGRGEAAGGQVRAASEAFQERTLQVLRVAFLSGMVLDIMIGMAIGLVAVLVAIQLLAGSLSLASGLLVLLLTPECYRPLQELGAQRHTAMEGKAARVRIEEILRTPAPLRGTPTSVAQPTLGHFDSARRGEPGGPPTINFSGVTYRFQDKNGGQERAVAALPSAVAGITLTLAAGTRT